MLAVSYANCFLLDVHVTVRRIQNWDYISFIDASIKKQSQSREICLE